jgi:O-antigen/teichoic acid export membrane protein
MWSVAGAAVTQGSVFFVNVAIAHMLGRNRFGEFSMIQSTALTLSGIAQVATGNTATRFIAEFRSTDKTRAGRILGICSALTAITACLAAFLLIIGAPWLAARTLAAPHLASELYLAAGIVLFSVMNGYQLGALAGLESYRASAMVGIAQAALHLTVCTLMAWRLGLAGAVFGHALSAALRWAMFHSVLRRESAKQGIKLTYAGMGGEKGIVHGFALPAALGGAFSMPALWLGNAFLVRQVNGYAEMGLYSAANSLRLVVLFIPTLFNGVSLSLLNNQRGLGHGTGYRRMFWANLAIVAATAFLGASIVSLLGRPLLRVFGTRFVEAYPVLVLLMLSTIPESAGFAAYQVIQSNSRMWVSLFAIAMPRDILFVTLSYVLAPRYGALGLALAYLIALTVAALLVSIVASSVGLGIGDVTRSSGRSRVGGID